MQAFASQSSLTVIDFWANPSRARGANIPASTSGRLVYVPRFAQRIRATVGAPKAEDYYLVIDGYDLAYEFDGPNAFVHVDAYAGTVKRISRWVD